MIFANKYNRIRYQTNSFLYSYKVVEGSLEQIKFDNKVIPYTTSSIDKSLQIAYIKAYNEFLERSRIGYNLLLDISKYAYNLKDGNSIQIKSIDIGYVQKGRFGTMDTTGTASGYGSSFLCQKALLELIEKNDLILIWYRFMGYSLVINDEIINILKKIGLDPKNISVFVCNNISSAFTSVTIMFDDYGNVVSSGVCCDLDVNKSVLNSLLEAKLLQKIYSDQSYSPFPQSLKNVYFNHISNMKSNMYKITLTELSKRFKREVEIELKDWVSSIYYCVLNTMEHQSFTTVRCFSEELLSCLPIKYNIMKNIDKKIIEKYNILNIIDSVPNCIIV